MAKKTSAKKLDIPVPPEFVAPPVTSPRRRFFWRYVLIGLAIILLILAAANKGWVVAAVVEGQPIFSWQLNQTLRSRYGQQTLEGIIGELLIAKEAQKAKVAVTEEDLKSKQQEILSSLGTEVNLKDFLQFQGLSEADFHQQLRVQLTVERLLTKDLAITEADIDAFIATNRATLVATQPADLRQEARQAIIGNTVNEQLQSWFTELRQKSKVLKLL